MNLKLIGSALIVAGTALGAGMLAIPMVLARLGFVGGSLVMLLVWAFTSYAALLLLEANLRVGVGSNMHGMAGKLLGKGGQWLTNASMMFLLYALLMAYVIGAGDLLHGTLASFGWHWPMMLCQLLVVLIGGLVVMLGTAAVDKFNRLLFAIMLICLLLALVMMLPRISFTHLYEMTPQLDGWMNTLPVLFTSFGFMVVIPSLVSYTNASGRQLRWVVLGGSGIPLVCYWLWFIACIGNLSAEHLSGLSGNVNQLVTALGHGMSELQPILHIFAAVALATSFLGVSLALFDLLAEICKRPNHRLGRFQSALMTLLPPLLIGILAPNQFLGALAYAGLALTFLAIFIPCAMVWCARKRNLVGEHAYQVIGGGMGLILCGLFGVLLIVAQF
ncbi:amino acid permease [Dongshaea marina]|uniref:amino acid permease n=1 Tax=Dongshaea marina TaxID=2047966 RepID=UPI000D3E4213|nr:aromatic amino acid transport family protein [Dongshaea marina]